VCLLNKSHDVIVEDHVEAKGTCTTQFDYKVYQRDQYYCGVSRNYSISQANMWQW